MSEIMSEADSGSDDPGVIRDLTAFQQNILVVLADEPMYGLAIKRTLEEYYGTDVNHGRLYPNLDDLVELGLVEKSELDKRTNQYELTREGEHALLARLDWVLERFISGNDERTNAVRALIDEHA